MATKENDWGGGGNFWAGLTGQSRKEVSKYEEDPNAFKQVGYDANKASLADEIARIRNLENNPLERVQASTAAEIDAGPQNQWRQRQSALADALALQAAGQGPSVAQQQLRQGVDRNIASQAALAGSQRGGNPALLARSVLMGAGAANQQAASDAAALRVQEQLNAQNALGQLTTSARGQDLTFGNQVSQNQQFNAGQIQRASELNTQMRQQNQQFIQNRISQLMNQGMSLDMAQSQANIDLQKFRAANEQFADQLNTNISINNANNTGALTRALVGGLLSGGGAALGQSLGKGGGGSQGGGGGGSGGGSGGGKGGGSGSGTGNGSGTGEGTGEGGEDYGGDDWGYGDGYDGGDGGYDYGGYDYGGAGDYGGGGDFGGGWA